MVGATVGGDRVTVHRLILDISRIRSNGQPKGAENGMSDEILRVEELCVRYHTAAGPDPRGGRRFLQLESRRKAGVGRRIGFGENQPPY